MAGPRPRRAATTRRPRRRDAVASRSSTTVAAGARDWVRKLRAVTRVVKPRVGAMSGITDCELVVAGPAAEIRRWEEWLTEVTIRAVESGARAGTEAGGRLSRSSGPGRARPATPCTALRSGTTTRARGPRARRPVGPASSCGWPASSTSGAWKASRSSTGTGSATACSSATSRRRPTRIARGGGGRRGGGGAQRPASPKYRAPGMGGRHRPAPEVRGGPRGSGCRRMTSA